MKGDNLMKGLGLGTIALATAVVASGYLTGARAADLGGNCCTDLEERIAELEATTARKGNRKVSLTISGWVGEQVISWDDGVESNTYVAGLGAELASNVKFTGQATIAPGWTAGYVLQMEMTGSDALLGIDQNVDNGVDVAFGNGTLANKVSAVQSYWFIKSERLGKLNVGYQAQASDNAAVFADGSGTLIQANIAPFEYGGFYLRDGNNNFVGASILHGKTFATIADVTAFSDANGLPTNSVRYDSPTFGGFSASASWGEDDFWDVVARYAGEHGGFKIAVNAAYSEATDDALELQPLLSAIGDASNFQIGAYAQHVGTGLFLYGAYSVTDFQDAKLDSDLWYLKGGIRAKWNPLGATVPYVEYEDARIDFQSGGEFSTVTLWGVGVIQEIDAAAMALWVSYRDIDADATALGPDVGLDFKYVKAGAIINF